MYTFFLKILICCLFLSPCIGKEINRLSSTMRAMQKSELHLHLGGAWPIKYLEEVATSEQFNELQLMLDAIQSGAVDYHGIFSVFNLITKIMHSDERVEHGVAALCKELQSDHVVYGEFRSGLKDLGSGVEGHLNAILRGIQRGTKDASLKVGLILSLRRDTSDLIAQQTIDLALKYRHQGVIGIDLSGDVTQGDGIDVFPALIRAKKHHLPITLHIGESKKETPEQQMLELLTIQPERIGHGVHLCEEGNQWVKEHCIPVELCLTSAIKAGMISDPKEHPALTLLLQGHPVAICTDDPLIFNTTLSEEYAHVATTTGLLPEALQELQEKLQCYHFINYKDR